MDSVSSVHSTVKLESSEKAQDNFYKFCNANGIVIKWLDSAAASKASACRIHCGGLRTSKTLRPRPAPYSSVLTSQKWLNVSEQVNDIGTVTCNGKTISVNGTRNPSDLCDSASSQSNRRRHRSLPHIPSQPIPCISSILPDRLSHRISSHLSPRFYLDAWERYQLGVLLDKVISHSHFQCC